jgi:hypothetical protein
MSSRWDPCISHRDAAARQFIADYFGQTDRDVLLVCGAGFDPRTTTNATLLHDATSARLQAHLIREHRPRPDATLLHSADTNQATLQALMPRSQVHKVDIFSEDEKTVVAGKRVVDMFRRLSLAGVTDIVVDVSALSTGISFPLIRYLVSLADATAGFPNVHVLVLTSPTTDDAVRTELMDQHQMVPGFGEELMTTAGAHKPKLWLPQLGKRATAALDVIQNRMRFDEICPILPFPARSPRAVEELVEAYRVQISETWLVDDRDLLYAAEDDPLDLYRTILRIDTLRRAAFQIEGGSMTVLSPLGTKAMALGALLAALERDLPIVYVETQRYKMTHPPGVQPYGLIHLWLTGQAYPAA